MEEYWVFNYFTNEVTRMFLLSKNLEELRAEGHYAVKDTLMTASKDRNLIVKMAKEHKIKAWLQLRKSDRFKYETELQKCKLWLLIYSSEKRF